MYTALSINMPLLAHEKTWEENETPNSSALSLWRQPEEEKHPRKSHITMITVNWLSWLGHIDNVLKA